MRRAMRTMNKVFFHMSIHSLFILSRSCGEHKEGVRRSVDKGVGGRRERVREEKVHNDDELPWERSIEDGDTNRLSLHRQTLWLVALSYPLPANNQFFFIQQALTTKNQPTVTHVCTMIVYCRSTTNGLVVVCCCAFQLSLCTRLLRCVYSFLQFPPGSKHILLSVVFSSSLLACLVYAEECNHGRTHWPFFSLLPLCALCPTPKLAALHKLAPHCLLCTVFHFSSRFPADKEE